jgi:drug/metabolite transporter (DMT)-like permease
MAYSRGAFTVVYPVMRGTGPIVTVLAAGVVFGEVFTATQWLGVLVLVAGIFGLAGYNLLHTPVGRRQLWVALGLAAATGVFVAAYTTYDAYGIRASADPFTFLAWLFMIDGILLPVVLWPRIMALPQDQRLALLRRGVTGAFVAYASFGGVMVATLLDKVGEAAVLRETSPVFAAIIGWVFLKETVGPRRLALMGLIALGAVIVEFGG